MKNDNVLWALILGISIIISAFILSYTFIRIRSLDNTLTVTGSARKRVTSDIVKWVGVFTRTVPANSLNKGYQQMSRDLNLVLEFLKKNGIDTNTVIISPVYLEQPWLYSDRQYSRDSILRQTVEVQSNDIRKITELAKNFQELTDNGVAFSTQSLEYYYSKLPELRINLLSEAMQDAKNRAEKIAESTGQKVGPIRSVHMGAVQVLAPNSTEISDYGTYNTSTIEKEVMVAVVATFYLK